MVSGTNSEFGTGKRIPWSLVIIPVAVFVGVVLYMIQPLFFPAELPEERLSSSASVVDAKAALHRRDYAQAGTLAREVLLRDPTVAEAYLVAGEAALRLGDAPLALTYLRGVPKSAQQEYVTSLWLMGNVLLYQAELRKAEEAYREVLKLDPLNCIAHERLAFILGIEGRRWESIPYLLEPIRQGQIYMEPLLLLGTVDTRSADAEQLIQQARKVNPDDWLPALGTARILASQGELPEAEKMLREILKHEPQQLEAHAQLGRILVDKGDAAEFQAWREQLPENADAHPLIWYDQGVWAQDHDEREGAARCYWETVRLNPNHQQANYRLGRVLTALGRAEEAEPFLQRARQLESLLQVLSPLYERREYQPGAAEMKKAAELSDALGRLWEAWAWYHLVLEADPKNADAQENVERLRKLLDRDTPLVLVNANPTRQVDLSSLPRPEFKMQSQAVAQGTGTGAQPRFVDVAPEAGLNFTYNNGDDPKVPGMRLCQELGGAMAVLDFDLDGWPDIYISQGGPWPADAGQTEYRDRLFRNLGNGKFADVTDQADLGDNLYSQGAAVGDIDSDGWPDLLIANLGPNRLYRNNGDGTFTEITQPAGIAGEAWSTSCAIADLTGDGAPDIYIVNYLAGKECLETECFEGGEKRACPPSNFPGEQDQLYINQGDGRFVDATQESGIVAPDGKGLGVVVADFHGDGKLSVYVSNDTTANFYFVNQAAERGEPVQFKDMGLLAGLAFDRDGMAQASMGIAAGDGDDDGLLDLFVTHFYQQSNTYYKQLGPDFFEDDTQSMGLREPSLRMLSFGTQFIDFELDGHLDLFLACGHVDDFRHTGQPYMMSPQLFANRGAGQFVELERKGVGDYFTGEYLGRSVALLDWDRDGKQDFAVLHLYQPSSLLANRTETTGHFLHLHLRGVQCDRDAIGTTVRATIGDRHLVRQLMAGNGYQCSNQRSVHFGLAEAPRIDQLTVRWPDGTEQSFADVPADREVMLIEGRDQLMDVPR